MAGAGGRYGLHIPGAARLHYSTGLIGATPLHTFRPAARGLSFSLSLRHFPRVSTRVL